MFHHIHLFINIMKARKRWKQFQKTKFKGRWNLYNLLQTTTNHLSPISDRPFHSLARLTNHTSVPQKKHQCGRWATLVFLASHASAGKNADTITISIQTNGSKILNWKQITTLILYSRQKHGVKYKKRYEFCFICIHSARMIRCRYIF